MGNAVCYFKNDSEDEIKFSTYSYDATVFDLAYRDYVCPSGEIITLKGPSHDLGLTIYWKHDDFEVVHRSHNGTLVYATELYLAKYRKQRDGGVPRARDIEMRSPCCE